MILDEFGQPIRKPTGFISPDWIRDSMAKLLKSDVDAYSQLAIEQKIDDLYESAEVDRPDRLIIGNTVRVKLPERYSQPPSNGDEA